MDVERHTAPKRCGQEGQWRRAGVLTTTADTRIDTRGSWYSDYEIDEPIALGSVPIVVLGLILQDSIENTFRNLYLTALMLAVFALGGGDTYTINARFVDAGQVVKGGLVQIAGRPVGKHYYPGPTWESVDGSKVVTEVKARSSPRGRAGSGPVG